MDRFHELTAFLAVVETGGFSAAARRIGDSQSAVSKSIGALEKRLGVMLFNRSTRSVTLTDQGRKYYERTKPLVEEMNEADSELSSSTESLAGLIRIAAPSTFGRLHILPLLPELLSQHPDIHVDLILSDGIRDMVDDRIDLAIRLSPVMDPDSVVRRVAATSLACVGSRAYFDKYGVPRHPSDLAEHNCLIYNDTTTWHFHTSNGPLGVPVSGNLSSNSVEPILSAVLAGVGIGRFYRASLVGELRHPDIMTVLDEFVSDARDVTLVWPKRRFVPARVRRVTDFFAALLPDRI